MPPLSLAMQQLLQIQVCKLNRITYKPNHSLNNAAAVSKSSCTCDAYSMV